MVSYTGWRRLIGSPKLQVIFRKRATNYRGLLWKVTYEDKGSYESSPPYSIHMTWNWQRKCLEWTFVTSMLGNF